MQYAENLAGEISQGQGDEGVKARLKEKIDGNKVMKWTGLTPGQDLGTILTMTQDWLYGNMDATDKEVKEFVINSYKELKAKQPATLEESYDTLLKSYREKTAIQRTSERHLL